MQIKINKIFKTKKYVHINNEHVGLFSSMIRSGISPIEALQSFNQNEYSDLAQVFASGEGYSMMFKKTNFSRKQLYIDLIQSGEDVGAVPSVLDQIVYIEQESKKRISQILTILIYPIIVLCVTAILLFLVLYLVIPSILPIIKSGGEISFVTETMIFFSNSIREYGVFYLVLLTVCTGTLIFLFRNKNSRMAIERIILSVPKISELYINYNCLNLTLMLQSYVEYTRDVPGAFKKISLDYPSIFFREAFLDISERVEYGTTLSIAIIQNSKLPTIWQIYVKTGENASTYSNVFRQLHEYYARVFNGQIQIIIKLLEPVLMVLVGIIVGCIAYGILSPLYSTMNQLNS